MPWQAPSTTRSIVIAVIVAAIAIALSAERRYLHSLCDEETVTELTNGTYVAALFHRDCSADEIVHVNLRKEGGSFGKTFWFGTVEEGEVLAAIQVSRPIEARWDGPRSLIIRVPGDTLLPSISAPRNYKGTRVTHIEKTWRDVTITLERVP
jgi:hypothetical protein